MAADLDALVAFVRARLDETEARAMKAQAVVRHLWESWVVTSGEASEHMVINANPARVLREVDAHRRILDEHQPRLTGFVRTMPGDSAGDAQRRFTERTEQVCSTCLSRGAGRAVAPCQTLRLLALPHSSHPDYREEWAPGA